MAFENIKAEIDILLQQMVNQPEDVHELESIVREKLQALKAEGLPVPGDLAELEEKLNRLLIRPTTR